MERIRQEAKRRRVSRETVMADLLNLVAAQPERQLVAVRDRRLEKYGFSYQNVDWDDPAQISGVILAEFVMEHLPPSRRELH